MAVADEHLQEMSRIAAMFSAGEVREEELFLTLYDEAQQSHNRYEAVWKEEKAR